MWIHDHRKSSWSDVFPPLACLHTTVSSSGYLTNLKPPDMLRCASYSAGASSASQSRSRSQRSAAGRSLNQIQAAIPTGLHLSTSARSPTGPAPVLGRSRPWMQSMLPRGALAPAASAAATGGASPATQPADGAAQQLPPCPVYEHVIFRKKAWGPEGAAAVCVPCVGVHGEGCSWGKMQLPARALSTNKDVKQHSLPCLQPPWTATQPRPSPSA